MDLRTILTTLVPSYTDDETTLPELSLYDTLTVGNTLDDFITCINKQLSNKTIDREVINQTIGNYEYVEGINKQKIQYSFSNSLTVNNDVILYLSWYCKVNIFLYNQNTRVMKVFYIEPALLTKEQSVLIFYSGESSDYKSFGVLNNNNISTFTYDSGYIEKTFPQVMLIPVGLELNKKLILDDTSNFKSTLISTASESDTFINVENIINKTPNLEKLKPVKMMTSAEMMNIYKTVLHNYYLYKSKTAGNKH